MSDLQTLIERLGQPPPEVCLDWALQLATLNGTGDGTTLGKVRSASCPAVAATWADVTVKPDGLLQLQPHLTGADSLVTVEPLIEHLLAWSEPQPTLAPSASATPSAGDLLSAKPWQRRLAQRAMQLATVAEQAYLRAADAGHDTQPRQPPAAGSPALNASRTRTKKKNGQSNKVGRPSKVPKLSPRLQLAVAIGIASLLVMTARISRYFLPSSNDVADHTTLAPPAQLSEGTPARSTEETHSGPITLENSADLLATGSVEEKGLLDNVLDDLSLAGIRESTDAFEPTVEKARSDGSGGSGAEPQTAADAESETRVFSSGPEANRAIDVLAEFESLSQSVGTQPAETMIPSELPSDPNLPPLPARPPLSISTFPMLQVQRLDLAVRARKPNWTLRLKTSDGFVVAPDEPQSISGRATAAWTIQGDQASDAMPQVLVQVQLTGNRSSALRWSVMAHVQDLPQVAMPLGQEFLDGLQTRLRHCEQLLELEIGRLRGLAGVDGLPADVRSAMSVRRRGLEEQSKLANRLLEFVADAMQMDGWLDGQIEVHAQLSDTASADSTPLLQFGELEPTSASNASVP